MIRAERASVGADAGLRVEFLEQVVGGQLDLLVAPLCSPVEASDQADAVETPEISVGERVPCLGFVRGTVGESEMPA